MPRQARFLPPNNAFHIMCRGNNGNQIFRSEEDYLRYLSLIKKYKDEHQFDLYHYCLMSNHVHFLIMVKEGKEFSGFMKKLNLSYFNYYQRNYGWNGHFWQDRFKSKLITEDIYLIQCGKYIELNPVRASIVEKPEDYRWSSYNFYFKGTRTKLITKDILFNSLGNTMQERQTAYTKMIVSDIYSFDNRTIAQGSRTSVYNANRRYRYHQENKHTPYRKS